MDLNCTTYCAITQQLTTYIIIHSAIPLDDITQIRMRRIQCDASIEFPVEASVLVRTLEKVLQRNRIGTKKWVPPKA